MQFLKLVHSHQLLTREGINIPYTSFVVSTCIAELAVSTYDIDIHGDLDPDLVPTPKQEARKMTRNPFDTQKTKSPMLCHAISSPS